jgi:hypothetical protein
MTSAENSFRSLTLYNSLSPIAEHPAAPPLFGEEHLEQARRKIRAL